MSGAEEDDWAKAAMSDDTMVAELLLCLRHTPPAPPLKPAAFTVKWSVRRRRSKSITVNNYRSTNKKMTRRASPTTPLLWSGAASLGGASDGSGFEQFETTRSKVVNGDGEKSASKTLRKRKTLPELKEDENLLIKERRDLKREIAALRENLEEQRAKNVILKRMKLELQPHLDRATTSRHEVSISGRFQKQITGGYPIHSSTPPVVSNYDITRQLSLSNGHTRPNRDSASPRFMLPDLNIAFNHSRSPANLY